ncbi:hypothetical protein C6P45_004389 [Maudiozyma exigua]|uniref:Bud site selection protein RAX2 n=1 Tax=Maudiozyma exigua TaxID=34358 RepID=A0A9P6WAD7_MAUEX|nr:hypothetical protein C6P45_004389 [Kazachstania exigua]
MLHTKLSYLCTLVWLPVLVYSNQLAHIESELGIETFNLPTLQNGIQLLGNIDTVSFYKYSGQQNFTNSESCSNAKSSLIYYSNDILVELLSSNEFSSNAMIDNIIPLSEDSFILSGIGSISNYDLSKQVVYNLTTLSIYPIFDESLNTVTTILVDNDTVYFGGNFTFNGSTGTYMWNFKDNVTSPLPFEGFSKNSKVNSILKLNDDNILFTGEFSTLGNNTYLTLKSDHDNNSSVNLTSIELGSLVSLKAATWTTGSSGRLDPSNLICPNNQKESWLQSGNTGSFTVNLPYDVIPAKIRLFNSPNSDNEVSVFRITTNPSNSILNLTYIDPLSGQLTYCDAFCPLYTTRILKSQAQNDSFSISDKVKLVSDNTTIIKWGQNYQDFAFVNPVDLESLTFHALNSYGSNVALMGFQLFQDSFNSFANDTLNEPNCNNETSVTSVSLSENDWKSVSNSINYISTHYTPEINTVPSVEFSVDLQYNGQYTIDLYTPGCSSDGTCSSRGIVNVTVWDTTDNSVISTKSIYQNNEQLKYDQLYSGTLNISTCRITLTYQKGLYATNSPVTIVADRAIVSIVKLDTSDLNQLTATNTKYHIGLNGLFQYQLSNFTSTFNASEDSVTETSLLQSVNDTLKMNASIIAKLYQNDTLLIADQNSGISVIKLGYDSEVYSIDSTEISGKVNSFNDFDDSIFIAGDNLKLSGAASNNLIYNGSFHQFTGNDGNQTKNFAYITIDDSELLVLNNNFIWNISDSQQVKNDSNLCLGIWSSAQNNYNDNIMYGSIGLNQFTDVNGSISVESNGTISSLGMHIASDAYLGLYLNSSSTVYAYESSSEENSLYFNNSMQVLNITSWPGRVSSILYSANQSLLAVGTSSSNGLGAQLTILNTTTNSVAHKQTLLGTSFNITGLLNFETNSTLLIGGDFNLTNVNCNGLCLYNYNTNNFSTFANGLISGYVTSLQFYNDTSFIVSGLYDSKNTSNISLSMFNLNTNELIPLRQNEEKLESFIVSNSSIIAWNMTNIFIYENEEWSHLQIPHTNYSSEISSVSVVTGSISGNSLTKRDYLSSNKILILNGQFYSSQYGTIQSYVYDFNQWAPYMTFEAGSNQETTNGANLFVDQDVTNMFNTPVILRNTNSTVTAPKTTSSGSSASATAMASSTPHPKKPHTKSKKIHRGFVVLIGLALALGTVAVLGLFGILLAALFRDEEIKYQPLTPHIDENDMVDTVPPEKLMKFM